MEDYLIDKETLEEFVDELLRVKPMPVSGADGLGKVKEEMMQSLDDRINKAMLSSLSDEQLAELEQMLDRGEESPEAYDSLYQNAGINLESIISNEMNLFREEYLGGENEQR